MKTLRLLSATILLSTAFTGALTSVAWAVPKVGMTTVWPGATAPPLAFRISFSGTP